MQTFVFFYNRFTDATTSKALWKNGISHKVLIHSDEDRRKFDRGNTLYGEPIVTNNGRGLAYQRNSALDLMEDGEWAVFMVDDFQKVLSRPIEEIKSAKTELPVTIANQNQYGLKAKDEISLKQMWELFPWLIETAEAQAINLIGFGLHTNPLNLRAKFNYGGLSDGRMWIVRKTEMRFDLNAQLIDDVCWTAKNILRDGKVLNLNWTVPLFRRYTAGGFGSIASRLEMRRAECAYLEMAYGPLVRRAKKKGWEEGTHVRLYTSKNNIAETRKKWKKEK